MSRNVARIGTWVLLWAALGLLNTASAQEGDFCPSKGCPSSACASGACESSDYASGGCPSCKKQGFMENIKEKCRNFDKEQLHPDHCWPEQYTREAQRRVYRPLGQQMLNGQRLEATLWDHYFQPAEEADDIETRSTLSNAGMARLQYLARKRPYPVPTIQLQSSFNNELDAKRIEVVQEYLGTVSMGNGAAFTVELANLGRPRGLNGMEAPKTIDNMIGIAGQPPRYEPQIKNSFLTGSGEDE